VLGSNITSIAPPDDDDTGAFEECVALESVIISHGISDIPDWTFAFCSSLTSITIPSSVTSIGTSAFQNCEALESVTIPDSVTFINAHAFADCEDLESVTIGNSVMLIDAQAFNGCSLTSVTIPNRVRTIGGNAFSCTSLTEVTLKWTTLTGVNVAANAFSGISLSPTLHVTSTFAALPSLGWADGATNVPWAGATWTIRVLTG
jgi:hypothetical protein